MTGDEQEAQLDRAASEDPRWGEATRRMHAWLADGQPVRVFSSQSAVIVMLLAALALVVVINGTGEQARMWWYQAPLFAVGLGYCVFGYVHAKKAKRLLPQPPFGPNQTPTSDLTPADQRDLNRQIIGKEPATAATTELVRASVEFRQSLARESVAGVFGMFLALFALSLSLSVPLTVVVLVTAAFVAIAALIEQRRHRRVLASLTADTSHAS